MNPLPAETTVWLKPTTWSPACAFVLVPKAQRALSNCRMWTCTVAPGKPAEEFGSDLCPLCKAGQVADGILVKRK